MGFGLFVLPIAGTLIVLGALAGLIAGAISEAGIGALVNGLMALGIPKDRALKYQARLQAGEFLVSIVPPAKGRGSCEIARTYLARRQISIHGDDLAEMEQLAHWSPR